MPSCNVTLIFKGYNTESYLTFHNIQAVMTNTKETQEQENTGANYFVIYGELLELVTRDSQITKYGYTWNSCSNSCDGPFFFFRIQCVHAVDSNGATLKFIWSRNSIFYYLTAWELRTELAAGDKWIYGPLDPPQSVFSRVNIYVCTRSSDRFGTLVPFALLALCAQM